MIKNIIFDIGGVLLDLDYDRTFDQLTEVMGIKMETQNIPAHIFKVILGYEKGEINTESFLWHLQKESSTLTPQPDKLIKAWNAMLVGWNPKRFEFLEDLKKNYALYILSNTNDLHLEWFRRDLKRNHDIEDFDTRFFEQTFYSHLLRMRKPELRIFEKVIEEAEFRADETLFVDDNVENVERARVAGFYAAYHDPNEEIIDKLDEYLAQIKP